MSSDLKVRRVAHYSGRVQGVGFRATARSIARSFRVAGYVKNLPDGRVELAAEGEPSEVDRFIESVRDRMSRNVTDLKVDTRQIQGDVDFKIER